MSEHLRPPSTIQPLAPELVAQSLALAALWFNIFPVVEVYVEFGSYSGLVLGAIVFDLTLVFSAIYLECQWQTWTCELLRFPNSTKTAPAKSGKKPVLVSFRIFVYHPRFRLCKKRREYVLN